MSDLSLGCWPMLADADDEDAGEDDEVPVKIEWRAAKLLDCAADWLLKLAPSPE